MAANVEKVAKKDPELDEDSDDDDDDMPAHSGAEIGSFFVASRRVASHSCRCNAGFESRGCGGRTRGAPVAARRAPPPPRGMRALRYRKRGARTRPSAAA